MRGKFFAAWFLALVLAAACAAPALAVPADGVYTYILDGAGVLNEYDKDSLEERAGYVAATYGLAPYVVTVETLSGTAADDAALSCYDEYAMGAGDSRVGAILLVSAEDGSHSFQVFNTEEVNVTAMDDMEAAFLKAFDEGWYEGFAQYIQGFVTYFAGSETAVKSGADGDLGGVDGYYILDLADILTDAEENALEEKAGSMARTYGFAPCVIIEDSLDGWGAEDKAKSYYSQYEMGIGPDNNGSLLYMSMEDRDFWYLVEDHASKVFDEYRYASVQEAFLKQFKRDDWYGGFSEYLNATEHYLSGAADAVEPGEDWNYYGSYVPDYADTGGDFFYYLPIFGIPVLLALLISLGLLAKMKTVRHAAYAGSYLKGNLKLRIKEDIYTHTTETRVKVESDSDRGGGGHGGGGGGSFSGGGKF